MFFSTVSDFVQTVLAIVFAIFIGILIVVHGYIQVKFYQKKAELQLEIEENENLESMFEGLKPTNHGTL